MTVEKIKNEELFDIPNWEGLYSITKLGKVYANPKPTGCNNKGMWLKQYDRSGYKRVALSKNGIVKHLMIHRLLAITFIPNNNKYPIINHKDGNTYNNSLDNLEWCTYKHNIQHAYNIGLSKGQTGEDNGASKLTWDEVNEIRGKYIPRKYSSRKLAKEYNVGKSTILRIVNNINWKRGEMANDGN